MALNKYLDIAPEVAAALAEGKPVVALESTIISHGMPYPQNVQTALAVEQIIRDNGAVPATIAIIGGRLKAGLSPEEIEYFGKKGLGITKASRRDLAVICARGMDGATTVTTTMMIAHMAGIKIFATGDGCCWMENLPCRMVNTTGCGDSSMAALVWAYLEELSLPDTVRAALAAGSITIESPETISPMMSADAIRERMG